MMGYGLFVSPPPPRPLSSVSYGLMFYVCEDFQLESSFYYRAPTASRETNE